MCASSALNDESTTNCSHGPELDAQAFHLPGDGLGRAPAHERALEVGIGAVDAAVRAAAGGLDAGSAEAAGLRAGGAEVGGQADGFQVVQRQLDDSTRQAPFDEQPRRDFPVAGDAVGDEQGAA